MRNLSFWAQSLDNQSPDVIFKDGERLADEQLRQQLVSEIYEVPKKSVEVLPSNSATTVRYSNSKFVIEAIPTERDQVNRLAPIVIYGRFPDHVSLDWIEDVCDEIERFVSDELERTLDSSTLAAIHDWLTRIVEKKKKVELRNQVTVLLTGLVVPLLAGGLIQAGNFQLTTLQVAGLVSLNNLAVFLLTFLKGKSYRRFRPR